MKKNFKVLGIIALVAIIGFSMSCGDGGTSGSGNPTPAADDFIVTGLSQITGSVAAVKIEPKLGKSTGTITIYYEGTDGTTYTKSTTPPTEAGTYAVTFDVAASTGFSAVKGLKAGKLVIQAQVANPQTPVAADFNISNLSQTAGSVTAVTITPKEGKSGGAITIYYEGTGSTTYTKSTTPPTAEGTYAVSFDIGASYGFTAATGLSAGTLTVSGSEPTPTPSSFTTPPTLTLVPDSGKITYTWTASTPSADTYDVYWKTGSDLTAANIKTGTKISGAVSGGIITGLTNGMAYSVIVTANKAGYASVDSAVETATPDSVYIITGSGTAFTATKGGATIGTTGTIQAVIDGIRTNAAKDACIIQFGDGTAVLNIGVASASFNNSGGTWGFITLTGKITGNVNNEDSGVIAIANDVSITSKADIANTANTTNTRSIYNASTGTLTISGGTVSVAEGRAVYHNSAGALNITGGTVSATTGRAVQNTSTGTISISGGTVQATTGIAVNNYSTGTLNITGGTFSATTGMAVQNNSTGTVTISGGTFSATTDRTVYNVSSGSVNITGGTFSATTGYAVLNYSTGAVTISGGTVSATTGQAVYNYSTGAVTISGGTVSATTGVAVCNFSNGKITVSQATGNTTLITSANTSTSYGTILLMPSGTDTAVRLEITGGRVENTASISIAYTVMNRSTGAVTISGGTVSTTSGDAVYNDSIGAVTISGGTVSTTSGDAVYNYSGGTVTISGGTVSATSGRAVYNCSIGKITVSQATGNTTLITSANTSSNYGTIFLMPSGNDTAVRLEITGGRVENTSTTTGNAIRNNSSGGVNITGGTVSKAGSSGYALFKGDTGAITVGSGATIVGNKYGM